MRLRNSLVPVLATVAVVATAALAAGCAGRTTTAATPSGPTASPPSTGSTDNGIAAMTPAIILGAAQAAADTADALRVRFEEPTESGLVVVDMVVSGLNAKGTRQRQATMEFAFIKVDEERFVRGTKEFYRTLFPEDQVARIGSRWAKVQPGFGDSRNAIFVDPRGVIREWLWMPIDDLATGDKVVIDGIPTIEVIDRTNGRIINVATVGLPYPIRAHSRGADSTIAFSDFGVTVPVSAPPASSVIEPTPLPPPPGCGLGLPPRIFRGTHAALCR